MQYCFFEDKTEAHLRPLTLTRPAADLRVGILTLGDKWRCALNAEINFGILRDELQPFFTTHKFENEPVCWINARFLPSRALIAKVKDLGPGTCIQQDDTLVAACTDAATAHSWKQSGQPNPNNMLVLEGKGCHAVDKLWDLFLLNRQQIIRDLERLKFPSSSQNKISTHAILENKEQIYIGSNATIEAGAMLLAGDGPVYIADDATVMAGAIVRGPAAICKGATVKMDAKIYDASTIGPVCKAGGEVSNSIFHSYSNKGHDGFVGNSLFGQWCNLGADTNTSNLKNNYSPIRITDWQSRNEKPTGQQFLGTVMGDHGKTAINTQLNTGTMCGVCCNIFGADFPPKFIPSFSWVGSNVIQPFKFGKATEMMQAMMARRNVALNDDYKTLMHRIFEDEHG